MFNYLPPGVITMICSISPINYIIARVHKSPAKINLWLIVKQAIACMTTGFRLLGIIWVWDNTQSSTTKSQALKEAQVALSFRWVTIYTNFSPSSLEGDTQFHLPSSSLRGWLLATGRAVRSLPKSVAQCPNSMHLDMLPQHRSQQDGMQWCPPVEDPNYVT